MNVHRTYTWIDLSRLPMAVTIYSLIDVTERSLGIVDNCHQTHLNIGTIVNTYLNRVTLLYCAIEREYSNSLCILPFAISHVHRWSKSIPMHGISGKDEQSTQCERMLSLKMPEDNKMFSPSALNMENWNSNYRVLNSEGRSEWFRCSSNEW